MFAHLLLLRSKKHHNKHLQSSFNKHGGDNFVFEILERIDESDVRDIRSIEQEYILKLKPHYNISLSTFAPMEGRRHSPETLLKLSKKANPNRVYSRYWLGKKWSPEVREKILKKRIGSKRSEMFKVERRDWALRNEIHKYLDGKNNKKIIDNEGIVYESLTQCATSNNVSICTVCDILKGRHLRTRNKKTFGYYEESEKEDIIEKLKNRLSSIKHHKSLKVIDCQGRVFNSIAECAKILGVSRRKLSGILKASPENKIRIGEKMYQYYRE